MFEIGPIRNADVNLDSVCRVGIGVVHYQALTDYRIRHNDHPVISGADPRASQTNIHNIAPRVQILNFDAITDPVGTIDHDHKTSDRIGKRLLGCQRDRQRSHAQRCDQGSDISFEMTEHDDQGNRQEGLSGAAA